MLKKKVEDSHLHLVRRNANSGEVFNRLLFKRAPEDDDDKPKVKKGKGKKKVTVTTAAPSGSTSTTTKKSSGSTTTSTTVDPSVSTSTTKEPSSSTTKRPSSSTTKKASGSTTESPAEIEKQLKEHELKLIDEAEEALFEWVKFMQMHASRTRNYSRTLAYYRFVGYTLKRYLRDSRPYNNERLYANMFRRKDGVPSRRQNLSLY